MIFYVREWIGTENRCKNILYKNVKNIYTICFGTIKDCKNCWWSTSESKRKDINCVIIIGVKDVRNQVIIFFFSQFATTHTHKDKHLRSKIKSRKRKYRNGFQHWVIFLSVYTFCAPFLDIIRLFLSQFHFCSNFFVQRFSFILLICTRFPFCYNYSSVGGTQKKGKRQRTKNETKKSK